MTRYAVAARVGVIVRDDEIFIARLPDGPVMRLDGSAAVIWREALSDDDRSIVDRVALVVGANASEIAADVEAFSATLLDQRLLIVRPDEGY